MQRRLFLRHSGASLLSVPFLPIIGQPFLQPASWQGWLQQIVEDCNIEIVKTTLYTNNLPTDWDKNKPADFLKTTGDYYFYQQQQYCFTIFEKYHAVAGLLELAIPFWKRQMDGSWKQLTCLSLFALEALASACKVLKEKDWQEGLPETYLLPVSSILPETYATAQGHVQMISIVEPAGVRTTIHITNKKGRVWQQSLKSAHCLTCQNAFS